MMSSVRPAATCSVTDVPDGHMALVSVVDGSSASSESQVAVADRQALLVTETETGDRLLMEPRPTRAPSHVSTPGVPVEAVMPL